MKVTVLFLVLIGVTMCMAELYSDRYDDLDVDEILGNQRLLTGYMKCVLDQGRCTPEGKELKLHIRDAMQTGCQKCTAKQQKKSRQVVKHVREKETEYWEQIKNKYDPKNEYTEIYERFLATED